MTIQRFKRLKKSKKYQSLIRLFGVRTEPISLNSTKFSFLSNQPFSFPMKFPYFSPKSDVISVPFSHLSAGRPLISFLLTFQVIFSSCFFEYFHEVKGQALTSYHTFFHSVRKLFFFSIQAS